MKTIIQPAQIEINKTVCDICSQESVSQLTFVGGYGSDFDLLEYKLDLCNEHGIELLKYLKNNYKNLQKKDLSF